MRFILFGPFCFSFAPVKIKDCSLPTPLTSEKRKNYGFIIQKISKFFGFRPGWKSFETQHRENKQNIVFTAQNPLRLDALFAQLHIQPTIQLPERANPVPTKGSVTFLNEEINLSRHPLLRFRIFAFMVISLNKRWRNNLWFHPTRFLRLNLIYKSLVFLANLFLLLSTFFMFIKKLFLCFFINLCCCLHFALLVIFVVHPKKKRKNVEEFTDCVILIATNISETELNFLLSTYILLRAFSHSTRLNLSCELFRSPSFRVLRHLNSWNSS